VFVILSSFLQKMASALDWFVLPDILALLAVELASRITVDGVGSRIYASDITAFVRLVKLTSKEVTRSCAALCHRQMNWFSSPEQTTAWCLAAAAHNMESVPGQNYPAIFLEHLERLRLHAEDPQPCCHFRFKVANEGEWYGLNTHGLLVPTLRE